MLPFSGMRGVFATRSFKKNELLFRIPSDCGLALSNPDLGGEDTPTIAHCGRNFLNLYRNHPTASKFWAPYLNSLPTENSNFDPSPDFFDEDEIEMLEFPRSVKLAQNRMVEVMTLSEEEDIPFSDLQFATWIVSSRSFEISIDDAGDKREDITAVIQVQNKKKIRVLVPYLDMVNHSSDFPNAAFHLVDAEKDDAWFSLKANGPIKKGQEIRIAYGNRYMNSVEMLQRYGFVPKGNQVDKAMLRKGGDDCIGVLEKWSTNIQVDETLLKSGDLSENMAKVLRLRLQLKKACALS